MSVILAQFYFSPYIFIFKDFCSVCFLFITYIYVFYVKYFRFYFYVAALLLDIIVIAVLKAFVRRRRPVPMNKLVPGNPDKYSFPSGHSSRAAMVAFILICIDPVSFIFYPPLLAWVGAVALSRVLAERHYFLDVFAGLGIGVLEGLLMSLIWFSQSTAVSIISVLSDEKKDGGEYHV